MKASFVEQHIIDCIRAAVIEADGDPERAARLRAQGKLRLVCMTEEEIWELAERTCCPPKRSIENAYQDIKNTIAEYRADTQRWIGETFGSTSPSAST